MSGGAPLAQLLLVEPQFVLRRTIVAVARDLGVAQLHEATSIDVGVSMLTARRFDGLVIAVDDKAAALNLLTRLRAGRFASGADIPVVTLAPSAQGSLTAELQPFALAATLRKPFKVAELLQVLQEMASVHA